MRVGVRVNRRELIEQVACRLPPVARPATSHVVERLYWIRAAGEQKRNIKPFNILYVDSIQHEKSLDIDSILRIFEDDIELYIAENTTHRLFIHAGVVGWHGRAILLPGKSLTGKSRLVARLLEAGASYYSDEFALLDRDGLVHPYPRPLALRTSPEESPTRIRNWGREPLSRKRPLPVGLIAFSQYEADGKWRPRPLSQGKAVLSLLSNTLSARRRPQLAMSVLPKLVTKAPAIQSARGDAEETAHALLQQADWS